MPSHSTDTRTLVASEFASRPTLRGLLAQEVLKILASHHSEVANANLPSADPIVLAVPGDMPYPSWNPRPILEVMLDSLRKGTSLASLSKRDDDLMFTVKPPFFLKDQHGEALEFTSVPLHATLAELDELLLELPILFNQAQLEYWAATGSQGVSRDCWLQQVIKSTLLRNLGAQGLDAEQSACVRSVLKGEGLPLYSVQVEMHEGDETRLQFRPELLIWAEKDERRVLLWCSPSSVVRAFDSPEALGLALRDELAEQQDFDTLTWHRYVLEGDAFSQQVALMLEGMLAGIEAGNYRDCSDVAALELWFAASSDPAGFFIEGYEAASDTSVPVPFGLRRATPVNGFAYQRGLFELALAQAESRGRSALDGIEGLHAYASARLRETLLEDYPDEANYFPDDLELTLTTARGMPGGAGAGVGGGIVGTRTMTLTQFAIGNLASLGGAELTQVRHLHDQLIMDWMTPDYVKSLVERVDIGGRYPLYVAQKMDATEGKSERIEAFAREWRCSLLFSALSAKTDQKIGEPGLQCVVDFCGCPPGKPLPLNLVLMPLAFRRSEDATQADRVSGMYVLFCAEPSVVLLYRPLYDKAPLTEYPSINAMMEALASAGALNASVLDWLPADARKIYDNGGFAHPHLPFPLVDPYTLPTDEAPAGFAASFWRTDIDAKLYQSNRDLLVELADRQSVSNAESHWALLVEGAWLLFDVATLLLRGPVAVVAWLMQSILALDSDLKQIDQGDSFGRSAAVVDLLLNLGMALAHMKLPIVELQPDLPRLLQDRAVLRGSGANVTPTEGKIYLGGEIAAQAQQLDLSWRGRQGFDALPAERRSALQAMQSSTDLQGLVAHDGVYSEGERRFVTMRAATYEVQVDAENVRVIDAAGNLGPWLRRVGDGWDVETRLRLRGGMPKSKVEKLREQNTAKLSALWERESVLITSTRASVQTFEKHHGELKIKLDHATYLESLPALDERQVRELDVTRKVSKLLRAAMLDDLRVLVKVDLAHDELLLEIEKIPTRDQVSLEVLQRQRSQVRQTLLERYEVYYNELAQLINNEDLGRLSDAILIHPESDEEISQYKSFVAVLTRTVDLETELCELARQLDSKLAETLDDSSLKFEGPEGERLDKDTYARGIIKQRRLSAIDVNFGLLKDLAEASLNRLAEVDESTLETYYGYLAGDGMKSAGTAHGDLAGTELSTAERIEVLSGVLSAYEESAAMADYLRSLGGPVIKPDMLKRYQDVLAGLRQLAEREMAEAVREQELAQPRTQRVRVYAPRGGRRRLVRTQQGRSVVGLEVEVDGVAVLQQREADGQRVLKTFRQQDGQWQEDVAPAAEVAEQPSVSDLGALRKSARALVDQVDSVIRLARQYVSSDEPHGLATVIDGHVEKLKRVMAELPRTELDQELQAALSDAIERLVGTRRTLLIGLYLASSHPSAESLRFLVQQRQVDIRRVGGRKKLQRSDYLDVYEVRRRPVSGQTIGDGLWEAHFHYPGMDTPNTAFSKGHLKLWSQRKLGRDAQMRAAATGRDLLAIYRGNLRLEQVQDLIPFGAADQ